MSVGLLDDARESSSSTCHLQRGQPGGPGTAGHINRVSAPRHKGEGFKVLYLTPGPS